MLILTFFIAIGESFADEPANKTYIWITIDTESTNYWPLLEQIDTNIDGVSCGISRMMDICDKYDVKATFFLNVYEYKVYGEAEIKKIARYIQKRGHDVQLHTHPEWTYDKERASLWEYSLQDQIKIIRDGKSLIEKWIGTSVLAHRAGGYLADNNTIKALAVNNIFIDSSFFFNSNNCKISYSILNVNSIRKIDEVWEIPVTLFTRQETPNLNILGLSPVVRYRKIDIDWADYESLKSSIIQANNNGIKVITLFLHSFSFLEDKERKPAVKDIEKFDNILSFITDHPNLQVVTSHALKPILCQVEKDKNYIDFVPNIEANISYVKYFKRRFLYSNTRMTAAMLGVTLGPIILAALVIFYNQKRKKYF